MSVERDSRIGGGKNKFVEEESVAGLALVAACQEAALSRQSRGSSPPVRAAPRTNWIPARTNWIQAWTLGLDSSLNPGLGPNLDPDLNSRPGFRPEIPAWIPDLDLDLEAGLDPDLDRALERRSVLRPGPAAGAVRAPSLAGPTGRQENQGPGSAAGTRPPNRPAPDRVPALTRPRGSGPGSRTPGGCRPFLPPWRGRRFRPSLPCLKAPAANRPSPQQQRARVLPLSSLHRRVASASRIKNPRRSSSPPSSSACGCRARPERVVGSELRWRGSRRAGRRARMKR
ncbi:uncharacterized protein LOC143676795 [Tamandua tetradactyla]|uniref:uncharacterized protein LOC143676795 n=1 Tax=Tamandua tetradactyla TaxID=48850 RepID=UPI0040542857